MCIGKPASSITPLLYPIQTLQSLLPCNRIIELPFVYTRIYADCMYYSLTLSIHQKALPPITLSLYMYVIFVIAHKSIPSWLILPIRRQHFYHLHFRVWIKLIQMSWHCKTWTVPWFLLEWTPLPSVSFWQALSARSKHMTPGYVWFCCLQSPTVWQVADII